MQTFVNITRPDCTSNELKPWQAFLKELTGKIWLIEARSARCGRCYAPTADSIAKTYRVVNTPEGVAELAARLRAAGRFALRVLPDPGVSVAEIRDETLGDQPLDVTSAV